MTRDLITHLWQSTFFAFAAALLTLAFRKNRAQVRYALWLSASLKFLIPFTLLTSLGSHLETRMPAAHNIATPAVSYTLEQFTEPLLPEFTPSPQPAPDKIQWIPLAILAVWLSGFLTIAFVRFRNWQQIRAAIQSSSPFIARPLPSRDCEGGVAQIPDSQANLQTLEVRITPGLLEPGVVGIFRPILLLPEEITKLLSPPELEAVLAHELCHVRRRDNLFATLHMIVEAIFWFHPLVWWIGASLLAERERACDEEVLRQGNQPDIYADAILNICKLCTESPLACVSGVTGADIRQRIEAIMQNRNLQGLSRAKKFLLGSAGFAAVASPVAVGLIIGIGNIPVIHAQPPASPVAQTSAPAPAAARIQTAQVQPTPPPVIAPRPPAAPRPTFDSASIKPCNPGDGVGRGRGGPGGGSPGDGPATGEGGYFGRSPGRLDITCASLMTMIDIAYVDFGNNPLTNDSQTPMRASERIRGIPGWAMSPRYMIETVTDNPIARGPTDGPNSPAWRLMVGPMLQALLEDRFQLKIHRETESVPMYALTIAKGGLKLEPTQEGDCKLPEPGPGGIGTSTRRLGPNDKPYCGRMDMAVNGPNRVILGGGVPLERIADFLSKVTLDRHVIDRTGNDRVFNIHMEFAPDENTPNKLNLPEMEVDPASDIPSGPSIFTALEQQLGLKLEPVRAPHGYIMIDSVSPPSAN